MSSLKNKEQQKKEHERKQGQYLIWKLNHEYIQSTHTETHATFFVRKEKKIVFTDF